MNRATIPMIKQQMIMHGIPFDQKDQKDTLLLKINVSNWVGAVEEQMAKQKKTTKGIQRRAQSFTN